MSRRRSKVSTAPLAIASDGSIVVNAYQLTVGVGLAEAIEVARRSGLDVFIGVVVPARLVPEVMRDSDDAAADVVGRLGPRLTVKRGRRR